MSHNARYKEYAVANRSDEERCEYLLKCALSQGGEIGCSCHNGSKCAEKLEEMCLLPLIQYPHEAIVAPYLFFLFNRIRGWINGLPQSILINGTMRCGDDLITVTKIIPFERGLDGRRLNEEHFCRPSQNMTPSETIDVKQRCHHENESTDRCGEWNPCLSITRINDGSKNCLNGSDEVGQTPVENEKSCAQVRRHRFLCSREQPTCLSVVALGDRSPSCRNGFDESWFGTGQRLSFILCNNQWKDECTILRQYIEQSSTTMTNNDMRSEIVIHFCSYCDTFWDLESRRDENLRECRHSWVCSQDQFKYHNGQCVERKWVEDAESDCQDASDEYGRLNITTQRALERASLHNFTNQSYFVPSHCNESHPFLCLSAEATRQGFSCFNLSQIGDGHIDCAGATDERNTLRHCSQSSSLMLGYHFLCQSTNTCISYLFHCWEDDYRCPRRSDDELWCDRPDEQSSDCFDRSDFVCFDGQCVQGGRCNRFLECPFAEDEYMCDYQSSLRETLIPHREEKQMSQRMKQHTIRLSRYPFDVNITELDLDSISIVQPSENFDSNSSSLSPYWCNRGLGVLSTNNSIVCFCPPHYYGEKCEFHADRLCVLLRLDLSQSNSSSSTNPMIVLQLLVLFLLSNETLMSDHFHLRPSSTLSTKKFHTHFVYPHSSSFREERRERFFNRSDLLHRHPFSIRIELYQTRLKEPPSLINVWNYPLSFDHLPVVRFVKVLHFNESSPHQNLCSSQSCHSTRQSQSLMDNNRSARLCLCKTKIIGHNYSKEEDRQCGNGYCALGSVCRTNSLSLFRRNSVPLCLCPLNRLGQRCFIEHSACPSAPCLNDGSCLPDKEPDRFVCVCAEGFLGPRCRWRRRSIRLSLRTGLLYAAGVIQLFRIDFTSLDLTVWDKQVFKRLPPQIQSDPEDQRTIPEITAVKLYSSHDDLSPDLYLHSVQINVISVRGRTEIPPINRCEHLRTFSNGKIPFTSFGGLFSPSQFRVVTHSISSDLHS